jgi:hypothetical protein
LREEVFISAFELSSDPTKYKFSDWIGSVRKDVECFFSILKNRFRFFKNPITLQSQGDVDNAFYTACILQNIILRDDGLDKLWEDKVNWETLNPDKENDDASDDFDPVVDEFYTPVYHGDDFVPAYVHELIPAADVRVYDYDFHCFQKLRMLLANHLQLTYRRGELRWPKTRKEIIDNLHNTLPRINFPGTGDLEDI